MSCVSYFSFNLVQATGTEFTASSVDEFFPATNIAHDFTTKVYRSQEGVTSAQVIMDFKTIEPIDSILVAPNSIDGFGFSGDLIIEANATADFSSPAYSTTLTPSYKFNFGVKALNTPESYRFWRVSGTNPAGNFVEFSKFFFGSKLELGTNNIDFGWSFENRDTSRVQLNRYAQQFIDRIGSSKRITANYKLLNITEVETLMDLFDYHGTSRPFWMIVDENETIINDQERFAGYFYFTRRPRIINSSFALYDCQIDLEEAL